MASKRERNRLRCEAAAVAKATKRETKIQLLGNTRTPEARLERMQMWENRNWLDRQQHDVSKGQGDKLPKTVTAHGKGKCGFTFHDYMVAL